MKIFKLPSELSKSVNPTKNWIQIHLNTLYTVRKREREKERERERQAGRQAGRQTDRQTERQADRQTGRQREM